MTSTGTYEEHLPCGGRLKISKTDWEILYYFPGPDLRHNGTFKNIPGSLIDQYIQAYQDNWQEYVQLKSAIPSGGDFSKTGKCGMTIRIGNFAQGVCLQSYHMAVSSEEQLKKVLDGYRYGAQRAVQVQEFLRAL